MGVDVGGVFDKDKHRYDHHQKSFTSTFNSLDSSKKWNTKLSSAGLVYFYFGREIIAHVLQVESKDQVVEKVFDKVYEGFVEEIDAIDNGISTHDGVPSGGMEEEVGMGGGGDWLAMLLLNISVH